MMIEPLHAELLREAIVAALRRANTLVGDKVYSPRDWPLASADVPALIVDDSLETCEGRGNLGFPAFRTTAHIVIDGRIERHAVNLVKADLATLRAQIKTTVLTDPTVQALIEQVVSIHTEAALSAENKQHVGTLRMVFALRYPEDFEPSVTDTLEGIDLHADLTAPFDPNGVAADHPFLEAVQPPPRTSGPDGRDEAFASFDFP